LLAGKRKKSDRVKVKQGMKVMARRIAIIEDETDLAQNYKAALERDRYVVDIYSDRKSALAAFDNALPDMAIIDIELGEDVKGGHALCLDLRARSKTLPILFLTARDTEMDEIIGLNLGANDYLSKTVSTQKILTRVGGLFKWYDALLQGEATFANVIEHSPLHMDIDRIAVTWRDQPVRLTYTEFRVLECLARHPGHVKNREQLMDAADKTIEEASVSTYIKRMRAAFREVDPDCDPFQSEYGIGYSWQGAGDT
jgi:two-component system OmpR family response regulator